ncbi:MAG: hypothetical protein AAF557_11065 [Pseudomonadota bacterium]
MTAAPRVRRLGRIFGSEMGPDWMVSHAAYPAPVLLQDRLRLFLVARDYDNRGQVGFIDLDQSDPLRVLGVSEQPCLTPGALGAFDDRGISIGCVHSQGGQMRMYYMGWNKAADVPFRNAIGMAVSTDDGLNFQRAYEGPLIDRSRFDPYTISYPFVLSNGDGWKMYYGTSRAGGADESKMDHILTSANSEDGIDWHPTGAVEVPLDVGEYGLSRPWVWTQDGQMSIYYSIRLAEYTIGVSVQRDGAFQRVTDDLMGKSSDDWDGHASCYPALIRAAGRTLLFYNGDGYGRTGVGVAEVIW